MPDDSKNSLTDEQIHVDFRTDPDFIPTVLKELGTIEELLANAAESDKVVVPVESLNAVRMGMRAAFKTQTELGSSRLVEGSHGDRGANCDYNPLIRVDWS